MPCELGQLDFAPLPPAPARRTTRRLSVATWRQILARPDNEARYNMNVLRLRASDSWPWLGSLSSSGAGSLWVRAGDGGHMVSAHAYGYQLLHGVVEPEAGEWPVIRHTCDEAWCQNFAHWQLGGPADNLNDWLRRRWHTGSPLRDVRGAGGRATAVREAARAAIAAGASTAAIAAAVREAAFAGAPAPEEVLF